MGRKIMSRALQIAIKHGEEDIAFNLIEYSKQHCFQQSIKEIDIENLLLTQKYRLIELLIENNALLLVDQNHLDIDDKF